MSESNLIRDFLSPEVVRAIATKIKSKLQNFDQVGFQDDILSILDEQTYSERKENITNALIKYLPQDFEQSVGILLSILPPAYDSDVLDSTVQRFYLVTYTNYISVQGMNHYDISMNALYEITKRFTSEWDIRPFLLQYPKKSFALLAKWVKDDNAHIRRLVSEGSRPNLPWGKKLKFVAENPEGTTLPLLSMLQNDDSEYVRRSIANHLNDIAKYKPDLVVDTLASWKNNKSTPEKDRLINHALRSLIKDGHNGALALIGYDDDFDITLKFTKVTKEVAWGDNLEFEFTITNNRQDNKKLLIDYVIGYQKKSGTIADKVFKLKKVELASSAEIKFSKKQSFKPISTRVYYPGAHKISIQVNGQLITTIDFTLLSI